jgi:sugar phosphate isomerase/epimerase
MRKLGIYVDHTRDDFEIFVKKVKNSGFDYIATQDSIEFLNLSDFERLKFIEKTRNICEKIGLKNIAHHSCPVLLSIDQNQKENLKKQFKYIDEIKNLDISFWVLHTRSIKDIERPWIEIEKIGLEKFDKIFCYVLKEICQYATQCKISIALENTPYPYTKKVVDILGIIEKVSMENLGICFDSGHSHISTDSIYDELEKTEKKLFTTHFHDNLGNEEKVFIDDKNISKYDLHLIPGLGIINWIKVNKILDKIDYKYPVVFEGIRRIENEDELLEITVKLWRSFEKLSKEVKNE